MHQTFFPSMSIKQFSPLSEAEKDLLLLAPAMVTVLIAGADDDIAKRETERAAKLVHYRTFTADFALHDYYEAVNARFRADLEALLKTWTPQEGQTALSARLEQTEAALAKIDANFAAELRKSWRSLAKKVAEAEGGVFHMGGISKAELKLVDLPMLGQ